jgi:replicative DNA helicase
MSRDTEAKVLCSLISDRYLLTRVVGDGFDSEVFHDTNFRLIFKMVQEMSQIPDHVIDWVTLEEDLKGKGRHNPEVAKALEELKTQEVLSPDQLMAYVDILKDQGMRDKLRKLANVVSEYAERNGPHKDQDFGEFSSRIIQSLVEMQKQRAKRKIQPIKETIQIIRDLANETKTEENRIIGFPMKPHGRLEHVLSGIRKGFFYGMAGPPRRGKTTLSLDIASRLAENNDFPVLFYTWEQTKRTLASRLLGRECYLNPVKLLTEVSPEEAKRHALINKVIDRSAMYSNNLYIIEAGRQDTIDRIKAQAYNIMHEFRTDDIAIFFDYLQKVPLHKQYEDIRGQVNEASAQLADLSLELQCPVWAISSMDKEGCKLDEKPPSYDEFSTTIYSRPTMHNCVGGGDIEYDLDVALILSKDWVATKNLHERLSIKDSEGKSSDLPQIDIINLHVDKNRDSSGETGATIQYAFFITINKFVEVGYKAADEYTKDHRGFAKAEDIFGSLLDTGMFKIQ